MVKNIWCHIDLHTVVQKRKMAQTVAEILVLPTVWKRCLQFSPTSPLKNQKIFLSDNTTFLKVGTIAEHLETKLITRLQSTGDFAIQLDEIPDILDCLTP